MSKEKRLNVRTDKLTLAKLNKAAKVTDIPYAQIVREAVKEKLSALAEQHPEINKVKAA